MGPRPLRYVPYSVCTEDPIPTVCLDGFLEIDCRFRSEANCPDIRFRLAPESKHVSMFSFPKFASCRNYGPVFQG